jgi:hypothetical protein
LRIAIVRLLRTLSSAMGVKLAEFEAILSQAAEEEQEMVLQQVL